MQKQDAQRWGDPCLSSNICILEGCYFLQIVYSVEENLFNNIYLVATLATQKILRYRRMKTRRAHLKVQ